MNSPAITATRHYKTNINHKQHQKQQQEQQQKPTGALPPKSPAISHAMSIISIESFIAGFAYGGTTVLVGQPLETLKTLTQVHSSTQKPSLVQTATNLYQQGGLRAFYRGGMPLLLGGGLMRSAQFGFYNRYNSVAVLLIYGDLQI
jgi:hypothetical protein